MNIYLVLFLAIAFEVAGTMLLPTTKEFSKLVPSSLVSIFLIKQCDMQAIEALL